MDSVTETAQAASDREEQVSFNTWSTNYIIFSNTIQKHVNRSIFGKYTSVSIYL